MGLATDEWSPNIVFALSVCSVLEADDLNAWRLEWLKWLSHIVADIPLSVFSKLS